MNTTSLRHLEIEACSVDTPSDFYVTGISTSNPKKAAKWKSTHFRVNFLL